MRFGAFEMASLARMRGPSSRKSQDIPKTQNGLDTRIPAPTKVVVSRVLVPESSRVRLKA